MKVRPAIVSAAVLAVEVALIVAVTLNVPGPAPLDGEIVTQLALLVADHAQPPGALILTGPLPPAGATLNDALLSVKVHTTGACVTVSV